MVLLRGVPFKIFALIAKGALGCINALAFNNAINTRIMRNWFAHLNLRFIKLKGLNLVIK